jgi:hypothetical protein
MSLAYAERYSSQVSEIASQMAGRKVVRAADICSVGTTSLYGVAASQYNRLKVDLNEGADDTRRIEWRDLGLTEGFGEQRHEERGVCGRS